MRTIVFLSVVATCTHALPVRSSGTMFFRTTELTNATCLKEGYSCARCMNPCCCTGLICDKSGAGTCCVCSHSYAYGVVSTFAAGPPKCEKPSSSSESWPPHPGPQCQTKLGGICGTYNGVVVDCCKGLTCKAIVPGRNPKHTSVCISAAAAAVETCRNNDDCERSNMFCGPDGLCHPGLETAEAVAGTVQMDEECYKILEPDKCWADKACKWGRYGCVLK